MIKTWQQRCEEHPEHEGIVTDQMIRDRMQEEIDELRQALAQPEQEAVCAHGVEKTKCGFCKHPEQEPAVKHMMRWVDLLKRLSDHGKYTKIPSGMTAGDCYELAVELEQFVKTAPPKREWVGLTHEERDEIDQNCRSQMEALFAVEAKLKEKNT